MPEDDQGRKSHGGGKPTGRDARLAEALRANLRKRKAQARARQRATDKEPKTPDDQG